ncbi:hypothetical protein NBRC111894_1652 [Sporolactobacillus inulinus]|uniref:Uncharacterized protein n=1 Tax=Sporolactobacillus inulinus TaxID=2078 RepID=A0A4Y1ZBI8_9BACL|nr:hypothetical protein NBRC111894_1652 [Sporolactobacillus inulinus]
MNIRPYQTKDEEGWLRCRVLAFYILLITTMFIKRNQPMKILQLSLSQLKMAKWLV